MKKRGFTSLELVMAVAIIGFLASIALSRFTGIKNSAKVANVQENLTSIRTGIGMYTSYTDEFPRESQLIRHNNGDGPDLAQVYFPPNRSSGEPTIYLSTFFNKSKFSKTPAYYSRNTVEISKVASVITVGSNYQSGDALYPNTPDSGTGGWIYREDDGEIRAFLARGAYGNSAINWSEF